MAKRARGSITTRPGQRRPLQRSSTRPTAAVAPTAPAAPVAPRPATLTDAEEARAAELEAAIVAEERRAEDMKRRSRTRTTDEAVPARPSSSLAVAAANEYAYVARDVRRIVLVGGSLIVLLLAMWVVAHIAHLGPF
jgi:hypothetical protein